MNIISELRLRALVGAMALTVVVGGCGPSGEKPKAEEKAKAAVEVPKAPVEAPKVAAPAAQPAPPAPVVTPPQAAAPKAAPMPPAAKWVLLGRVQADFRKGRDRIVVGKSAGAFRELRVTVRDAPMELHEMIVTFGNDRVFRPPVKFIFDAKTTSGRIDLPGDRRAIKHVDFVFRSPNRYEGLATLILHGR